MTRKRFIKLLMGNEWSRFWARDMANGVIEDNIDVARINHMWKFNGIESSHRVAFVPYEFCLPIEIQEKYKCGYCKCTTEK